MPKLYTSWLLSSHLSQWLAPPAVAKGAALLPPYCCGAGWIPLGYPSSFMLPEKLMATGTVLRGVGGGRGGYRPYVTTEYNSLVDTGSCPHRITQTVIDGVILPRRCRNIPKRLSETQTSLIDILRRQPFPPRSHPTLTEGSRSEFHVKTASA